VGFTRAQLGYPHTVSAADHCPRVAGTTIAVWAEGTSGEMRTTWKQHTIRGALTEQKRIELPDSAFAFPEQRKEPLVDAKHVRNALARFDQVDGVTDGDRELAFANIRAAAEAYGIDVSEQSWRDLGKPGASSTN